MLGGDLTLPPALQVRSSYVMKAPMISQREHVQSVQNGPLQRVKKEPRFLSRDEQKGSATHMPLWTGQDRTGTSY